TPVMGALTLAGHVLALATMMLYARYVVLDVQGLIEHKPRRPAPAPKSRATKEMSHAAAAPAGAASSAATAPAAKRAVELKPAPQWDEDDEAGDADDDEPGDRRLSKAERKRLRKIQARQNRAA